MYRGAILLLGLLATDLAAQAPGSIKPQPPNQPPRYVRFPINGNPEQMLADFLKTKEGQDIFQQILQGKWQDLLQQPPEMLEKILREKGNDNPIVRELVEKFLKDHPGLQKGDPVALEDALKKFGAKLEGNKDFADMILKSLEQKFGPDGMPKIPDLVPPVAPGDLPDVPLPKVEDFMDDDLSLEDRFGEWLSDMLKNESVQHDLAEFFKDAPDLQDAVGDLLRSLQGPSANGNWMPKLPAGGAGKWNFDLKPPKMPFDLGRLPKMPTVKMPQLPRLNLPMPKLGNIGGPRMPGFGGGPNMPGGPSFSAGGEWAYLVVAVLAIGLLWWFLRKVDWSSRSRGAQAAALLAALPSVITTRTQLRQAFDALAILRLGEKALPWNHRHIARQLAGAPAASDAANAFANLYEMARYTPGDDRLSATEQNAVRDSLAVLTGGEA